MNKSDRPFDMEQLAKNALFNANESTINIGKALRYLRNSGCYKDLDYKTFNQYVSSLGIMPRSARRYISIVEKYIDELKVEEERLYSITPARLEKMIPFANSENVDEWLGSAEICSNKDFIDLVNAERNVPVAQQDFNMLNGDKLGAGPEHTYPARLFPKEYMAMVKKADCVLCPGKKNYGRGHHFPITVGAGAKEWWVIPLCEICHVEAHHDPKEFLWKYKKQIMKWIYSLIVEE